MDTELPSLSEPFLSGEVLDELLLGFVQSAEYKEASREPGPTTTQKASPPRPHPQSRRCAAEQVCTISVQEGPAEAELGCVSGELAAQPGPQSGAWQHGEAASETHQDSASGLPAQADATALPSKNTPEASVNTCSTVRRSARCSKRSARSLTRPYAEDILDNGLHSDDGQACTEGQQRVSVIYRGNPSAPYAIAEEQRKVKRGIANRESARRVRQEKASGFEDQCSQLQETLQRQQRMQEHVQQGDELNMDMFRQMQSMHRSLRDVLAEHSELQEKLRRLQQT